MLLMKTYGPYVGRDGRRRVVHLYRAPTGDRTSSESYARFLWRQHHGDIPAGMEVDHVNGDRTDDRIENYQLLSMPANRSKAFKDNPGMVAKLAEGLRKVQPMGVAASRAKSRRAG